jgi:hypothetical protein
MQRHPPLAPFLLHALLHGRLDLDPEGDAGVIFERFFSLSYSFHSPCLKFTSCGRCISTMFDRGQSSGYLFFLLLKLLRVFCLTLGF